MGDWHLGQGLVKNKRYPAFVDGTGPYYTNVESSSSANVKGAWTEVAASTEFEASQIVIDLCRIAEFSSRNCLVDVAIGGSGSEVVIISNLLKSVNVRDEYLEGSIFPFPISIPKGSRVSIRHQCSVGTSTLRAAVIIFESNFIANPGSKVTSYGAVTATSLGTTVDAGATVNTKGAWSELSAETTDEAKGFILSLSADVGGVRDDDKHFLLDIGVGSLGNEVPIFSDFYLHQTTDMGYILPQFTYFIGRHIPKGSRLVARMASSENDAVDRIMKVVLHSVS